MVVSMKDVLHCESEYNRGAGCGKTARPDLYGGLCVNEVPTMTPVCLSQTILVTRHQYDYL
jgi:hypothetical protein